MRAPLVETRRWKPLVEAPASDVPSEDRHLALRAIEGGLVDDLAGEWIGTSGGEPDDVAILREIDERLAGVGTTVRLADHCEDNYNPELPRVYARGFGEFYAALQRAGWRAKGIS